MGFRKCNTTVVDFGYGTVGIFLYDHGVGLDVIEEGHCVGEFLYNKEQHITLDEDCILFNFGNNLDSVDVLISQLEAYKEKVQNKGNDNYDNA